MPEPSPAERAGGTENEIRARELLRERFAQLHAKLESAEARADQLQRERDQALQENESILQQVAEDYHYQRAERAEAALRQIADVDPGVGAAYIARAALAGETGAANRYGHGRGCVCPLCSQTTTALAGETTDDAIHFAAPWEPRSSLCGQWDKNLAPIDRLGDVGGTRCWTCLQVRDWILNAIPQAALAGETSP